MTAMSIHLLCSDVISDSERTNRRQGQSYDRDNEYASDGAIAHGVRAEELIDVVTVLPEDEAC